MKRFFLFFLFVSGFYILFHVYVAYFLTKFFGDKYKLRQLFLLLAMLSISSLFLRRFFYNELVSYIYFFSFLWMGAIFLAAFIFLFADLFYKFTNINFNKIFLISVLVWFFCFSYSFINGFSMPKVNEITFYSNKIDKDYVFYFFSDIHLDFEFKNKVFKKIFEFINNSEAEFVVIGGDLFDPGFRFKEFMKNISKKPVFFVNGNHEYYFGIENVEKYLKLMGFYNITSKSITYGKMNIIGIDDIKTTHLSLEDIKSFLLKKYNKDFFNLIISHQPMYFEELAKDYEFIMISGHTHCGQIFPFHLFTRAAYKYFCGEYSFNKSKLYVSSGAGVWGPNMRLLSKSEVLKIIIKKDERI